MLLVLAIGADRDALTPVEDAPGSRDEVGETTKRGVSAYRSTSQSIFGGTDGQTYLTIHEFG